MDDLHIVELLDADPRLIYVVDRLVREETGGPAITYHNRALKNNKKLTSELHAAFQHKSAVQTWIQELPKMSQPSDETFYFGGLHWAAVVVRSRWVCVYGSSSEKASISNSYKKATLLPDGAVPDVAVLGHTRANRSDKIDYDGHVGLLTSLYETPDYGEDAGGGITDNAALTDALARSTLEITQSTQRFQRYQRILEMVDVGIFEFHPNGQLLSANDAWYAQSSHPPAERTETEYSFMDYVHEEDKDMAFSQWVQLSKGEPVTFEMRWKKRNSEWFSVGSDERTETWVLAACVPVVDDNGALVSVSGCTTNITAQKENAIEALQRAEAIERARASEQKLSRFAEMAPVALFILDVDQKVQFCNDKWFTMLGMARTDPKDIDWRGAIWHEDMPIIQQVWDRLIIHQESVDFQFRLTRTWRHPSDGMESQAWVLASVYPTLDDHGLVCAVQGTQIDISELKWAEKVQRLRVEEALEAKRQQENFIDMTSHEMRNPLSVVVQCADSIVTMLTQTTAILNRTQDRLEPSLHDELLECLDSALDAIQTIISCSTHQKRIVDDILVLSKLDAKLLMITPVRVRALSVLEDAKRMFMSEAERVGIHLALEADTSLDSLGVEWVMLDPSRVLQVLINLVANAIKFTQFSSTKDIVLTMSASPARPSDSDLAFQFIPSRLMLDSDDSITPEYGDGQPIYLSFAVRDTGCGMTCEGKEKIFQRFSQASPRTHVQYGGSGLGLFISRELVELQGGEIGFASEADTGSTFAFFIKCRMCAAPATNDVESTFTVDGRTDDANRDEKPEQVTVLIVEDNLVNQKVLSKQLRRLGWEVHVAGHGGEALDFIKTTKYWNGSESLGRELTVILMDIEMPVMDGLTCARKIRDLEKRGDLRAHIPIVAVSANARSEQMKESQLAGMDEAIAKPFRIPDLIPKVERLSGLKRANGVNTRT
ncbi:hypothetical protein LTR66_007570 [Elasticomyces elasticus]|nr:hypothetical protein LTR66_007570 [Elasticomyces elasticus]